MGHRSMNDSTPAGWTPEQEERLLARVRTLVDEKIGPHANRVAEQDDFAWETFRLLADEGVIATAFPRELGGTAAPMRLRVRIIETLARVCSAAASLVTGTDLAGRPIVAGASESLAREIVPKLARGELQSAFALTERQAGSDVAGLRTSARRITRLDGGEAFALDGTKRYITRATVADLFVVVARVDGIAGARGLTAFLVDRDTPGLVVGPQQPKMGWYGVPIAEVMLRGAEVPRERMLGAEGEGFTIAQDTLLRARIGHAAIALGRAQGALDMAAQYAGMRRTFGKSLGEHQGVQWMLADMATRIEAARCLTHACADRYDRGDPDAAIHASMAKLLATDLGMQVTTDCLQLFGGNGYLKTLPLERFMRDAKLNQIGEGASEIHKTLIGRHVVRRAAGMRHPCLDPDALGLEEPQ
jgi:alkylation response protein AidB-like acyl-CoA dehydrogenase